MAVLQKVVQRDFGRGRPILELQEPAAGLFFIVQGEAIVSVPEPSNEGFVRKARTLHAGDHFGELSLLLNRPISANVSANQEYGCSVSILQSTDFHKLRHEFPEMS
eukprot:3330396-Prymnesium_polylepis.1